MNISHLYCVIMAGGIGARFWPVSRESKPKQFLDFTASGKTLLRTTYERVSGIIPPENILVVSLTRYRAQVIRQIPELPEENLLLEPYSRNTAPCIAFAAYSLLKRDPDAVMVAVPSDHVISDLYLYQSTLLSAFESAIAKDSLITLGVVPTRPDTNFGYVQFTSEDQKYEEGQVLKVKTFTEKPDAELADVFIKSGEFLWNCGIFIWKASVIKEELERYAPEITNLWEGWENHLGTSSERFFLEKVYGECPKISIDYAVMEKTDRAWIRPARFGWADIGNWESLYDYLSSLDENGNATNIQGKSILKSNSKNIIISKNSNKLVAVRGLENYIVVDSDDILMICPRDESNIKDFISELAMPEYENFR